MSPKTNCTCPPPPALLGHGGAEHLKDECPVHGQETPGWVLHSRRQPIDLSVIPPRDAAQDNKRGDA